MIRSKTKEFCKYFLQKKRSQLQNDEILQNFLTFGNWQHQKRSISASFFFQNGKLSAKLTASYQCVCIFACHEKYEVVHLSRRIHLANLKIWCSKIVSLRKSAPWPPNMSDVSCIAPATRHECLLMFTDLQTFHAWHPFWNRAPPKMQRFQKWSERGVLFTFWLRFCFAPQQRALLWRFNFQKWSEAVRF